MLHNLRLFVFFSCLVTPLLLRAQLTGKVSGENGEALPFATVYVRNTTNGTTANANGEYRLPLEPGEYEVVYQYLGYKQRIEKINMKGAALRRNVTLDAADLQIKEVVITAEDPAYRIMREAIAKRKYHRDMIDQYACDVYVKGFYKMLDTPKKIFGEEIGNMGGILDSAGSGVIYLSESVSKLYVQKDPYKSKEEMISSKVSGNTNGFSLNRANLVEFTLYEEHTNIDRDILSPLADNAFTYYDFKLKGEFTDENGNLVYKIALNPKRADDPVWDGFVYIVDSWWNVYGTDVFLTGPNIKQPILDTLRFHQEYTLAEKPDKWALLSQATDFRFGIFGFDIGGFFNSVMSNYNIAPRFEADFFTRETFRINDDANKRDTAYWTQVRPIPLTEEEVKDYVKKDSLEVIWESKAFQDSMDRKDNRFQFMNVLSGYSWRNSFKNEEFSIGSPLSIVQFNTVQGMVLGSALSYRKKADKLNTSYWDADGAVSYGFADRRLRYEAGIKRKFESIHYRTVALRGGIRAEQFNERMPISVIVNELYSMNSRRNYMKLYDKTFAQGEYSQMLTPWLKGGVEVEYASRQLLENRSDYVFKNLLIDPADAYTPNTTIRSDEDGFVNPYEKNSDAFTLQLDARIRLGATYSSYPKFRLYNEGNTPEIRLRYRKALPGVGNSSINYNYVQAMVVQENLNTGLLGYSNWAVSAGAFLNRNNVAMMDFYIPMGNRTIFSGPGQRTEQFNLLPYYEYATRNSFVEAHWEHHLQGWLFDKIPGFRKLKFKEIVGAKFYYSDQTIGQELLGNQTLPYWELNFGIENIGIGPIRPLRIDFAFGFNGDQYTRNGVLLGLSL